MNQQQEILQSWNRYSATAVRSPQFLKAQQFFQLISDRPDLCWEALVPEFRKNYYDAFEIIVSVLKDTDDPMIIHNLVRFADLSNPQEANATKTFIQNCNPDKHQVTLMELAAVPDMRTELQKKPVLPDSVRTSLGLGKASTPATPTS